MSAAGEIETVSRASATAVRAYVSLAIGICVPRPVGILLLVGAFVLACRFGAHATRRADARDDAAPLFAWIAALPVMLFFAPTPGPAIGAYDAATRALAIAAFVLVGVAALTRGRARGAAVAIVVVLAVAMNALTPIAVPRPNIDVWQLFEHATVNMAHGKNPYTTPIPDIYEGGSNFGYHVEVFSYPPLNLVASLPAVLLGGDYRFALVAATTVTALVLRAIARRSGAPVLVDLLVLAFVLHPRALFVTGLGWSEPFLLLAFAATALAHVRAPGGVAEAIAACLLPLTKQYAALPSLLWLGTRPRPRAVAIGVIASIATLAPFLLWNARATVTWGFLFQLRGTSFRNDAMSIPGALFPLTHAEWPKWPAFAAQVVVGVGASIALRKMEFAGWVLASTLALFASFLLGWQAFTNYYYLLGALLLFAAALARRA